MTGIRPLAKESMDGVLSDARAAATDLVGISDKITLGPVSTTLNLIRFAYSPLAIG